MAYPNKIPNPPSGFDFERVSELREALQVMDPIALDLNSSPRPKVKTPNYTWNSFSDLKKYLFTLTGQKETKYVDFVLSNWQETLTKAPAYSESTSTEDVKKEEFKPAEESKLDENLPNAGLRQLQQEELEYRKSETEISKTKAKAKVKMDVEELKARYKGRKIWAKKKDGEPIPTITLSSKDIKTVEKFREIAQKNPEVLQKEIATKIENTISQVEGADFSSEVVDLVAKDFVTKSASLPEKIAPQQIVQNPASPISAFWNINDKTLIELIPDYKIRQDFVSASQDLSLLSAANRDVSTILTSSFLPNDLQDFYYGIATQTIYEPTQDNGEQSVEFDIGQLIDNTDEIRDLVEEITKTNTIPEEISSYTSAPPAYIQNKNLSTTESIKKEIDSSDLLGHIDGFKTQYELAQRIQKLKALRQTSQAANLVPILTGASIGATSTSIASVLTTLHVSNTPLLMSGAVGKMLTSGGVNSLALSSLATRGEILFSAGIGKFSFNIVGLSNGVKELYAAGVNFGSKGFGLAVAKSGGNIVGTGIITSAGGQVAGKALPTIFTKILTFLGSIDPIVGTIIGAIVGWIIDKVVSLLPRIRGWIDKNKEVLTIVGLAGYLFSPFMGARIGFLMMGGMGMAAVAAGGFKILNAINSARNLGSAIFTVAFENVAKVLLITVLILPIIVAFFLFIINSGAYIVPPSALSGPGGFSSPYMDVQKTAQLPGPFQNSDLKPLVVTYNITIRPKRGALSNLQISDKCDIVSRSKSGCPTPQNIQAGIDSNLENLNSLPTTAITSISPTSTYTISYTLTFDRSFSDSSIINTVTVVADESSQPGVSATTSNSITIGSPPISCPVIGGHAASPLLNYSYNSSNDTGHGSTKYWTAMHENYSYALPQSTGCMKPADCPYYGYAYDVFPTGSTAVFAPSVLGKDTSWNCSYAFSNGGGSAGYTYHCLSTDGNYMLVLTHVNKDIRSGVVNSGQRLGTLFNQGTNTHLHIEFQLNGRYVKPENYFCIPK